MHDYLYLARNVCYIYAGIFLILLFPYEYLFEWHRTARVLAVLCAIGSLVWVIPAQDFIRIKRLLSHANNELS